MKEYDPDLLETSLAFVIDITSGEIDTKARKEELKQEISVTKRRYAKTLEKYRKLYRNSLNKSSDNSNKLAQISEKKIKLKNKLLASQHEYGAILAAELGVPLNYVLSSIAYTKNGETHLILGMLDPEIEPYHGHIVIGNDGNCRYLRFPTEEHGKANVIKEPSPPKNAVLDRIIQLSKRCAEDQS